MQCPSHAVSRFAAGYDHPTIPPCLQIGECAFCCAVGLLCSVSDSSRPRSLRHVFHTLVHHADHFFLLLGKQKFLSWNAGHQRCSARGAEPSDGTSLLYLDIVCILKQRSAASQPLCFPALSWKDFPCSSMMRAFALHANDCRTNSY